jgi:hypothetical protein
MIANATSISAKLQNETAARIMTASLFQNLKMPDGTAWEVRTEDEGIVEELFKQYIANTGGLLIVVNSPTGVFNKDYRLTGNGPVIDPFEFDISLSEAVMFNRNLGTKIPIMDAMEIVTQMIKNWTPSSITNKPIWPLRWVKDETQLLADGTTTIVRRRIECEITGVELGPPDIASP